MEIMNLFEVELGQAGADLSLSRDRFRLTRLEEEEGYRVPPLRVGLNGVQRFIVRLASSLGTLQKSTRCGLESIFSRFATF